MTEKVISYMCPPVAAVSKEHVHEALACLYSPTDLAACPLAELLPECRDLSDPARRGQALRRLLLDTVELLRPTGKVAPTASQYRAYECISLRYISSLPVEEIAEELALSPRQVYRDLHWGETRLAELLEAQRCRAPDHADPLSQEIEALARKPEAVRLAEVLQGAVSTLAPLAARYGSSLSYRGPDKGVVVTATPGMLKEAVMQMLSAVVQNTKAGDITVELATEAEMAILSVPVGHTESWTREDLMQAALRVLEAQNWCYELLPTSDGAVLRFRFPLAKRHRVLILEDNPSASALYERYLANSDWEPILAPHPSLAGNLAVAKQAKAIVLDIMMPETDGWSVLQALKLDQRSRRIPVVICSVVNDPELGLALGASRYLTKPVSRPELLEALEQVLQECRPASDEPDTT